MKNQVHQLFPYKISIAPMIGHTDKFYRVLLRYITKKTWLYTDMIHEYTMLQKKLRLSLIPDKEESPLILQLGGDNAKPLCLAAKRGEDLGYDEININAGCPSKKLRAKKFGIYLMDDIENTVDIISSIKNSVDIPVSIKCRIGYDGTKYGMPKEDSYEFLKHYVSECIEAGASRISMHARTAIIGGLNADANREVPPINYDYVYRIAKDFKGYPIEINGNINSFEECLEHLKHADAVMIGREAVQNPLMFICADDIFFSNDMEQALKKYQSKKFWEEVAYKRAIEIVQEYAEYLMEHVSKANHKSYRLFISQSIRHLLTFFDRYPRGDAWKASIKQSLALADNPQEAINKALKTLTP